MMEKKETNEKIIVIPDEIVKQIKEAPKKVQEEIERLIQGFQDGTIDPMKVGKPMNILDCEEKLKCAECKSKNISWIIEVEDKEVFYKCADCKAKGWMTLEEYEEAKKVCPQLVFRSAKK